GEHEKNPPHFRKTQEGSPDFIEYRESGYALHGFHSHVLPEDRMKKNMAVYYSMISLMDKYIGKILDQLDELGLTDSTIVVFTSDHGHLFGQHGMNFKGAFHYEDLLRVPFLVRYPGEVPAGEVSNSLLSLVDLAPTFLNMAGLPVPEPMTGVDQSKAWRDTGEKVRDHVICENHHEPTTVHLKTYVNERYKITIYYNQTYGELFDLEEDPHEVNNLWENPAYRDLKESLLLKYIWAELGKEPMWMPRISGA
ncbi:MAG TPA: sulfatase/phosphatase domain-containing protein, partial [Bacillales bacterium]